jgi:ketosteroid isomerase-like protein
MDERDEIAVLSTAIAQAICRRDTPGLRGLLATNFVHRTPGAGAAGVDAFLQAIAGIPGEILFVTLEQLDIDVTEHGALATGIQHAQVRIDGQVADDRRAFVDWFVKEADGWRLRVAVDLPAPPGT